MNHYGVIMAGGGGTRFWPLSRQKTPKQLLNLSGKDLMVNEAIDRMSTVIERNNNFIITSEVQASAMESATVNKILKKNTITNVLTCFLSKIFCINLSLRQGSNFKK